VCRIRTDINLLTYPFFFPFWWLLAFSFDTRGPIQISLLLLVGSFLLLGRRPKVFSGKR